MYLFETTDELIQEMINNEKVCNYFDIPIQHISNKMLKSMHRFDTKEIIYDRVEKIRQMDENAILRTTVITGFPGETKEDFNELIQAVKDLKFDRLGAFAFSKEEGTKAYSLENQIDEEIKNERLKKIFDIQKGISLTQNKKRIGKKYEVVVEDVSEDDKYFVCRSRFEAPDVDGKIYLKIDENSANKVIIGDFTNVVIIDCDEYDLFAKLA